MFCFGVSAGFRDRRSAATETSCGKYEEGPPGKGLDIGWNRVLPSWGAPEPASESPLAALGQLVSEVHPIISKPAPPANKQKEKSRLKVANRIARCPRGRELFGTSDAHG